MLKNLKILSILGLLLSVGNSYTWSKTLLKTPKKYVTATEARNYGYTDDYNSLDSANREFTDTKLNKKFIMTNQNFELRNKTKSKIMVIAEIYNSITGCKFLGLEKIEPGKASETFTNIEIPEQHMSPADRLQIKIIYADKNKSLPTYEANYGNHCAKNMALDRTVGFLIANPQFKDGSPKGTFYLTLDGDSVQSSNLRPQTGQLGKFMGIETGLASKTETGLYIGNNILKGSISKQGTIISTNPFIKTNIQY